VDEVSVHRFRSAIESSNTASFGFGSWMDAGTADAVLRRFLTFQSAQRAVIGAWEHGGRFDASPYRTSDGPAKPNLQGQWAEMLQFFDAYLKDGHSDVRPVKTLFYYTLGEERWKTTTVWPPAGTRMRRLYLGEGGTLSPNEPTMEEACDVYKVDFDATTGDQNRWWEMAAVMGKTVVYNDRTRAAEHLLTYTTGPLSDDLEITGYPVATLYVSSTETDGAFYVYLEDVDEHGHVTYVTEGQLRAIHRKVSPGGSPYTLQVPHHSFTKADAMPMVPGELTEITFGLQPTSVLIKRGHRIRIGIAGHDKGTFARIPAEETPVWTLYRNRSHASYVELPAVPRSG
jgi:putative CocE/NonD family hydrolase